MPRNKDSEAPSDDIGWKFADMGADRHSMSCKLCGKRVTGGITRLKQHLAHLKGQIVSCPNVSTEIREQMMKHILNTNARKAEKQKVRDEVGAQIRATQRQYDDDYDDECDVNPQIVLSSDESDPDIAIAMRQSARERREWEDTQRFRSQVGGRYEAGGSSGIGGSQGKTPSGQSKSFLGRRSASLRGTSATRKWTDPNSPEARLAAMDPALHRGKNLKQQKISTGKLKTLRAKLGGAVSQFLIYGRHSANAVLNPWFKPMLDVAREVGPNVELPTPYEVSEVYLPKEYDAIKEWIQSQKPIWEERGVTLMCDGWTGPTRKHLINFLVYSNRGTIFLKAVDATDVPSRTADYYLSLLEKAVHEVGEKYVVQVVTDNEPAMKLAGKKLMERMPHLYWTACAAHCLDLILEDIGKKKSVAKVLDSAKKITSFIYQSTWLVDLMKNFTNNRELLRPAVTRFATNFITLESLVRNKKGLEEMFSSSQWRNSKWGRMKSGIGIEVKNIIYESSFWTKASEILKIQKPLIKVLRLVDGDEKPTMGFIYEAIDRAKLAIQKECRYYKKYWSIIDKRWSFQLHHDLHAAGYFLNPLFQYGGALSKHAEVMDGLKKVIQRLEPNIDRQIRAVNQFRDKQDSFGTPIAQRAVQFTNPAEWWIHYGASAPELQQIAVKVLSQTTSASNCERNWSTFSLIHTKTRNRLKYLKLNKLVYVYYNMRLKIRYATRRSQKEIDDHFNPINLDYIFEEDDPLAPWLQEREPPTLDGQDNSDWLSDSDEEGVGQANNNQNSSSPANSGDGHDGLSQSSSNSDSSPSGGTTDSRPMRMLQDIGAGSRNAASPFRGEFGNHGFRDDEEVGEDTTLAQFQRGRGHPSRRNNNDHTVMHQFGQLGVGRQGWSTQPYPSYPTHTQIPQGHQPSYYSPPPQSQIPQGHQPSYYPPPPQYYYNPYPPPPPPPHQYHGVQYASDIFGPPIPYGYVMRPETSSGSGNYSMDTRSGSSNYDHIQPPRRQASGDDDDVTGRYQDPPRHSFWV